MKPIIAIVALLFLSMSSHGNQHQFSEIEKAEITATVLAACGAIIQDENLAAMVYDADRTEWASVNEAFKQKLQSRFSMNDAQKIHQLGKSLVEMADSVTDLLSTETTLEALRKCRFFLKHIEDL